MAAQFKKFGWFYLPTHVLGFLIVFGAAFTLLHFAKWTSHTSHTLMEMAYKFFPIAVCHFFCYEWIAKKLARQ